MFLEILAILLPVAVCVAIGFGLARRHEAFPTQHIGVIVADVGAPCLVFHSLAGLKLEVGLLLQMALGSALIIAVFSVLGFLFVRVMGWPMVYAPPTIFANTGNMGLPLCLFAFGEEGMGLAVAMFAAFAILQFSYGIWIWSGSASPSVMLKSPLAWAGVLGFVWTWQQWPVPLWLANTTKLIGGLTIPLMLITLGVSLSSMRITTLSRSVAVGVVRLALGPLVGILLADALGLQGTARGVLILQSSMPPAVFNYLLSLRYDRSPQEVAGTIVVSTAMSALSLPVVLAFLL